MRSTSNSGGETGKHMSNNPPFDRLFMTRSAPPVHFSCLRCNVHLSRHSKRRDIKKPGVGIVPVGDDSISAMLVLLWLTRASYSPVNLPYKTILPVCTLIFLDFLLGAGVFYLHTFLSMQLADTYFHHDINCKISLIKLCLFEKSLNKKGPRKRRTVR